MGLAVDRNPNLTSAEVRDGERLGRRGYLVLILALLLPGCSLTQKALRLSLPSDGWQTTTDFQTDEPIFTRNLTDKPSELRAGDKLLAVGGAPFLTLEERSLRGRSSDLAYRAGETARYTVLRGANKLEVAAPLYPISSLGAGTLLRQLFASNQVGGVLLWAAILISAFLFWRRPNNLTAQLLFLQIAVSAAAAISWLISPLSSADVLRPSTFFAASFFSHWIHAVLEQPLGLHIILSFPRPAAILKKAWALPLIYSPPLIAFAVMFIFPNLAPAPAFLSVVLYNLLGIVLVVRMFFAFKEPVERAQVRWFGFGFAVSNLGTLFFALWAAGLLPERWFGVTESLPYNLVFLGCIGVALLRHRLFDIDVILSRTLVWGGLTAGVVGLYALLVGGLGRWLEIRGHFGVSLLATGLIAVAFDPVRMRLQQGVNRLLYGDRDEPYKVLSDISHGLGAAPRLRSVLPVMTNSIARALKLPYVAVALEDDGSTHLSAETGTPQQAVLSLPLSYQAERVGELRLGLRANETRFSASERKLLEVIAQQASVAAYAASLSRSLQRSREQLVTAREEERRRLRRDLHDGLGPTLASMTLKLDVTRTLVHERPDAADALLQNLKLQTQLAVSDIRELVYALRPPALDELGLLGALREQLASADGEGLRTDFYAPAQLPELPAATEVAVYRIVQEALTNTQRHAEATRCTVRLVLTGALRLEVDDDGLGLSAARRPGVGLRSMREWAEELGGSFSTARLEPSGTRIVACLPLPGPSGREATQ